LGSAGFSSSSFNKKVILIKTKLGRYKSPADFWHILKYNNKKDRNITAHSSGIRSEDPRRVTNYAPEKKNYSPLDIRPSLVRRNISDLGLITWSGFKREKSKYFRGKSV
jgi:hypothetical protein